MRPAMLLSLVLFVVTPVCNGQKPTRRVFIEGTNPSPSFEQDVISALNARLAGTTRFSITGDDMKAELLISLMCIDTQRLGFPNTKGGVCSYTITYYPQELNG